MALDPSLLSGAINGTGDTSQSIFRRKPVTPTPGAAPAPQGIASPAPAAAAPDDGQSALVSASGGEAPAKPPVNPIWNPNPGRDYSIASQLQPLNFQPSPTGNGPAPTPIGRAASLVSAAAPTTTGNGITTLPTMTVTPPAPLADVGASPAQAGFLASNGVPLSQQTATAIGGDGSYYKSPTDNSTTQRRAAIQAGTVPGQNVRLGYDGTSRIYGTSSKPGGPIDTFTGIGTRDPNNPTTNIDGASAVAANQVGLGLTPDASARSAQVRADAANGGIAGGLSAQLDNARGVAAGTTRDLNSNLSRASDPFDPIGRQIMSLRNQLGRETTRSGREAINSQINAIYGSLAGNGQAGATAKNGVENAGINSVTSLTGTGMTQAGDTQRANILQAGETQRLGMQQNAPTAEVTTDGGYRVRTGTSVAPVTGIDGKPVDAPLGAQTSEAGRALQGYANQIGQAIASGSITPEAASDALTQGRIALTAPRAQGVAAPTPSSAVQPPKEAAQFLRQNPSYKAQFDAKYGRGAADRVLGNG